jgi:ectoine hydroxylase-related dioxygenase (phytanoyl-CoA dioxygenase family)
MPCGPPDVVRLCAPYVHVSDMGRGSSQLHTFWLPFHDIDLSTGGLTVVEGSSQRPGFARLRETFGMQEQFVTLGQDPAELTATDPAARWVTTEYEAGDLVVFGSASPAWLVLGLLHPVLSMSLDLT